MAKKCLGWVGYIGGAGLPRPTSWMFAWFLDRYRYNDLKQWIGMLGLEKKLILHPDNKEDITNPIASDQDIIAYVANAHGDYEEATLKKDQELHVNDLEQALGPGRLMKFSFLIHSNAMDHYENEDPPNTPKNWSSVLRNNTTTGTVVIGVRYGMTDGKWIHFQLHWWNVFWTLVDRGKTFWQAFLEAEKGGHLWSREHGHSHMVFAGDPTLRKQDLK